MSAALLLVALSLDQAPTLTPPPLPSDFPPALDGQLLKEERAQLTRELSQLRRERPPIGYSLLMVSAGIFTFVVSGLLATNAMSTLFVPSIIGLIVGGLCTLVGLLTGIVSLTRLNELNQRIAVKQRELDALPRLPPAEGPGPPQPL
jgi:hypothetical protein